jgi:2-amino-4-hydroxy-6-hydroxymethyldihydropteridine diphosphokinase/dihydropteroate synthase
VSGRLSIDTCKEIADRNCSIVSVHSLSVPPTMSQTISLDIDPNAVINDWAQRQIEFFIKAGFDIERIILDPGIGFGKIRYHSIDLIRKISNLNNYGCKTLIGHSRKKFISTFSRDYTEESLSDTNRYKSMNNYDIETISISSAVAKNVDFIRVHNLKDHMKFFTALNVATISS